MHANNWIENFNHVILKKLGEAEGSKAVTRARAEFKQHGRDANEFCRVVAGRWADLVKARRQAPRRLERSLPIRPSEGLGFLPTIAGEGGMLEFDRSRREHALDRDPARSYTLPARLLYRCRYLRCRTRGDLLSRLAYGGHA